MEVEENTELLNLRSSGRESFVVEDPEQMTDSIKEFNNQIYTVSAYVCE